MPTLTEATRTYTLPEPWDGVTLDVFPAATRRLQWKASRKPTRTYSEAEAFLIKFGDECLAAWNVKDEDGQPMPATGDGVLSCHPALLSAIVAAVFR